MENKKDMDKIEKCCNRNCFKNHCARHWKNHKDPDAWNLNPYDQSKCPKYLPKFAVRDRNGYERIDGVITKKNTR